MVFTMPSVQTLASPSAPPLSLTPQSKTPIVSITPLSEDDREFRQMAEQAARKEVRRATFGFGLHSTALQIKDQHKSKWFYTQVLGMDVVKETEMHDVTMIFLAFPTPIDTEDDLLEFGQRRGLIQLIHVAGSEDDDNFVVSHRSPGFCHLCVSVPDLEKSLNRMRSLGVEIVEEGTNEQGYGAVADPDGYSIQLLHCQIDQSLALKRQLEEMMSASSGSSSNRRPSNPSSANDVSLNDLTRQVSSNSSGPPAFSTFRGGSPNFDHPHWQMTGIVSDTEGNSGGLPVATAPPMGAGSPVGHSSRLAVPAGGLHPSSPHFASGGPSTSPQLPSSTDCGASSIPTPATITDGGHPATFVADDNVTPIKGADTAASSVPPQVALSGSSSSHASGRFSQALSGSRTSSPSGSGRIFRKNAPKSIDLGMSPSTSQQSSKSADNAIGSARLKSRGREREQKAISKGAPSAAGTRQALVSPPAQRSANGMPRSNRKSDHRAVHVKAHSSGTSPTTPSAPVTPQTKPAKRPGTASGTGGSAGLGSSFKNFKNRFSLGGPNSAQSSGSLAALTK